RISRPLVLDVVDYDLGPIAGETFGNRPADSPRAAGDDGDLVLELHALALPAWQSQAKDSRCGVQPGLGSATSGALEGCRKLVRRGGARQQLIADNEGWRALDIQLVCPMLTA